MFRSVKEALAYWDAKTRGPGLAQPRWEDRVQSSYAASEDWVWVGAALLSYPGSGSDVIAAIRWATTSDAPEGGPALTVTNSCPPRVYWHLWNTLLEAGILQLQTPPNAEWISFVDLNSGETLRHCKLTD